MNLAEKSYPGYERFQRPGWTLALLALWLLIGLLISCGFNATERAAVLSTLALGVAAATLSLALAMVLAASLYRAGPRCRLAASALLFALLLPVYWQLAAWDSLFGKLGWWAAFAGSPLQLAVPQWMAAVWVHGISGIAQATVIMLLFLIGSGRMAEEQALVDASPATVFWRVTLPRLGPAILCAGGWCFLTTTREIAVTDIYRIGTVAEQVYLGFALGQFDQLLTLWPEGEQALSLRLYLFTVLMIAGVAGLWVARVSRWAGIGELRNWREIVGASRHADRLVAVSVLVLILVVPLLSLIFRAGVRVKLSAGLPRAEWSLADLLLSLLRAFQESQDEFVWSLAIAISAASLLLVFAVIGVGAARESRFRMFLLLSSISVAIGMPGPICGTLVAQVWNTLDYQWAWWLADRTILLPVLASCLFCWPLAALFVLLLLRMVPRELDEAAAIQGISGWRALIAIRLAGNRRILLGGWVLLVVTVFGDLSAQQMVAVPGIDTIPRQLLGWMHAGVDELAAATSLLVAGILSLVLGGTLWLVRR